MLSINLSECRSVDDVHKAVCNGIPAEDLVVRNRREARRLFRSRNIRGRVRSSVVFREHKTLEAAGPLRRDILVCVLVEEFRPEKDPETKAFSVEIITY